MDTWLRYHKELLWIYEVEAKDMTINNSNLFIFSIQLMTPAYTCSDGISNIAFGSIFDNSTATVLDHAGDAAIIQFQNGTTYNLHVPEYSECVAHLCQKAYPDT